MILGVGTDLVEIARVRKALAQSSGERFIERILTPRERELALIRKGRMAEFVAGRFAAKEAVVKAIGCGIGKQIGFQDVEVLPDSQGKPLCVIAEAAMQRAGFRNEVKIHLSITHTESLASAYVIVEKVALA